MESSQVAQDVWGVHRTLLRGDRAIELHEMFDLVG